MGSSEQIASTPAMTSMDQIVCKPECRDEVLPGSSDVRSMCEKDSCKGCPQCEMLTTLAPSPKYSVEKLQADGKLPGDGQSRFTENGASEGCTGGPDCSGKDFASCERMQAQGICTWARSVVTTAPASEFASSITPEAPPDTQSSVAAHLNTSINIVIAIVAAIIFH